LRLHSAGFSLYETSAKGNAMGGANVGRTGDASAVYANPANMTELPGVQSMTGVTLIRPSGQVETPTGTTNVRSDWFPHAYATWQTADRWWLGMGLYSEYGLGTRYPDDWAGRYNAIKTTMETFTLNPNVAYRVTDDLSVAIGFRAMYLDFYNKKAVPLAGGYTELDGDAWGFGYNAAVSYAITDDLDIGLVYRSRVKEPVEGTIDYSGSLVPAYDKSTGAEADLTLPSSVTAGLNYQATDRLNLGTAVTWTEWSTYDALNIDFDQPVLGKTGSDTEKNWSDVWRFGVGADYALTKRWSLQCGYVYDMCPIDSNHADFMMPAGDRHIGSLGVGYAWSTWAVNLSYSYLMMVDNAKVVDIAGTATPVRFEDGCAHMVGLSVLKKF
jgi:long-chain fatty acid transport protein